MDRPSVVTIAADNNPDPNICIRVTNQVMAFGSSSGADNVMILGSMMGPKASTSAYASSHGSWGR